MADSAADDTDTAERDPKRAKAGRRGWRGPGSPLVRRILAVNLIALAILGGGVLYLNDFRASLIERRLDQLAVEADIIAGAIGESATEGGPDPGIDLAQARLIVARLVVPGETRGRLFGVDGALLVDSRFLTGGNAVLAEPLPPLDAPVSFRRRLSAVADWVLDLFTEQPDVPPYREEARQQAIDYSEAVLALAGERSTRLRRLEEDTLILSAAVPVQRFRRVLGALMLTADTKEIEAIVRLEQITIVEVFAVALAVTSALSVFLAFSIARPVRRLALAAERVRHGMGRGESIPEFDRNDEIGDLSAALAEMTAALYRQIDAIEAFAADVSHELKNPLSSLRSAVESLERTDKPEIRARLLAIIQEDVRRLDRLITDISDASRLDAEMSRAQMEPVDLGGLVAHLVEAKRRTDEDGITILYSQPAPGTIMVRGLESRLSQVVANLLDNALSFSPPGGRIVATLRRRKGRVELLIEDEGPGLPKGAAEKIFSRFYSERPEDEAFGTHSGLGLSISKQIVEAHGGEIAAENRIADSGAADEGSVAGARFIVRLPAEPRAG